MKTKMPTIQDEFEMTFERSHTELYKELEVINLESRFSEQSIRKGQNNLLEVDEKSLLVKDANNKTISVKTFENEHEIKGDVHFHQATWFLMLSGQIFGLNSVMGILGNDPSKLRFTFSSHKFFFSLLIFILQSGAFMICWHNMIQKSMDIRKLANVIFYGLTGMATGIFMKVSMNWPSLVKAVAASNLEEYMDARLKRRCNITIVVLMTLTIVEHILSLIARIASITDCFPTASKNIFRVYTENGYPWFFELGITYNLSIGILFQALFMYGLPTYRQLDYRLPTDHHVIKYLYRFSFSLVSHVLEYLSYAKPASSYPVEQEDCISFVEPGASRVSMEIFNTIVILGWNYYDIFIICMSIYITSILERIHQKIVSAKMTKTTIEFWRCMREDYTRASRLVRSFDDVISSVVFISFAGNLFIICMDIFNIMAPFNGYENAIYFYYSLVFVLGRTLIVSLVTANVHTTFMMVAPELYELPSSVYCDEIQRFIYQVHNDNVAFSGLQFFYVTKKMILSVVATIATYELVLLQFSSEDDD